MLDNIMDILLYCYIIAAGLRSIRAITGPAGLRDDVQSRVFRIRECRKGMCPILWVQYMTELMAGW